MRRKNGRLRLWAVAFWLLVWQGGSMALAATTGGRMLLVHTGALAVKSTRDTQGVAVMTQKRGQRLAKVTPYVEGSLQKPHRYRTRTLPAAGSLPAAEDQGEQLTL